MRTCILLVGDAPNILGGLARIARDVASQVLSDQGCDVYQAGLRYDGSVWPWHVFPIHDEMEWGAADWPRIFGELSRGYDACVVLSIWDPHRCLSLMEFVRTQRGKGALLALWGYFPVDGAAPDGGFGGPAAAAVQGYDRVLAYGQYGSRVLERVCGRPIEALPHGLTDDWYPRPDAKARVLEWLGWEDDGRPLVGVVATNQARKDWGTAFAAIASLKARLWCHVDVLERFWSLTQLVEVFELQPTDVVITSVVSDARLADLYSACSATFAPGLGEGFGYPIAESLACGTPVVHVDYAGGVDLVPTRSWLVKPAASRVEGLYAVQRPVLDPNDVAEALRWVLARRLPPPGWFLLQTNHLRWRRLTPRWRAWVCEGLEALPWSGSEAG